MNNYQKHQKQISELNGKPTHRFGSLEESESIVPEDYKIFETKY